MSAQLNPLNPVGGVSDLASQLKALSSAEDFLRFFGVCYDERVVHVNRLHILKRFFQYLQRDPVSLASGDAPLDEVSVFKRYRTLLMRAYEDFVSSSAQAEKVFKVFQDATGNHPVPLSQLRASLAERRVDQAKAA